MRHPTDGALRRLLDEPAGVADADREHVAGCPSCLAGVAAARDDADRAGAALAIDAGLGDLDVDAAWQRLVDELEAEGRRHGEGGVPAPPMAGPPARPPARRRRRGRAPGGCRRRRRRGLAADLPHRAGRADPDHAGRPRQAPRPLLLRRRWICARCPRSARSRMPRPRRSRRASRSRGSARCPAASPATPAFQVGDEVVARVHVLRTQDQGRRRGSGRAAPAAAGRPRRQPLPAGGRPGSRDGLGGGPRRAGAGRGPRGRAHRRRPRASRSTTARDYLLSLPSLPEDVAAQLRGFSARRDDAAAAGARRRAGRARRRRSAGCRPRC